MYAARCVQFCTVYCVKSACCVEEYASRSMEVDPMKLFRFDDLRRQPHGDCAEKVASRKHRRNTGPKERGNPHAGICESEVAANLEYQPTVKCRWHCNYPAG